MNLLHHGDGTFPSIVFHDGQLWMIHQAGPVLRIAPVDGATERLIALPDAAAAFPVITRFEGQLFVAWRHGVEGRLWNLTEGSHTVFAPEVHGNHPILLAEGRVYWQTAAAVLHHPLRGGSLEVARTEQRPTGIVRVLDGQVRFWDEDRLLVPGMSCPMFAADFVVGQGSSGGSIVSDLITKKEAHLWPDADSFEPVIAYDLRSERIGVATWGANAVRSAVLQVSELTVVAPPQKLKPIPLDQIEPLVGDYFVGFYEQNGNCPADKLPPGNAMVAVRNQEGPQPRPMILTFETEGKITGDVIGFRIGSEAQFEGEVVTIEVMEARARAVFERGYRPWFYWDEPTTPRPPILPAGSVIEVFGFCGKDESIPDWERDRRQRLLEAAAWPGNYLLAISAQTHDTNDSLKPEPSVMIPPMMRLCVWARAEFGDRFLGIDIFCNSGRDFADGSRGGLTANPQLVTYWTKVFSGVTGLPDVLLGGNGGNGGGGGGNVLAIRLGPYERTISRGAPYGLDVPWDVDSDRPIARGKFQMQDGSTALEWSYKIAPGTDGRYFRGLRFKPTINGAHRFILTLWDDQDNQVSVTSEPVTVTSSGNGGGGGLTKNYFDVIHRRWAELNMDAKQRDALAAGGKDAVTRLHAEWLFQVAKELKAQGEPVGLEWYRNPVPGTDIHLSADILLVKDGGVIYSVDVIAGTNADWSQGRPNWHVHDVLPNPDDWREA